MNIPKVPNPRFKIDSPWGSMGGMSPMGSLSGTVQFSAGAEPMRPGQTFQNVLNNTLQSVNGVTQKPDLLMREAMTTGSVDIHDVMVANAKAELAVSLTAQFTTKVVQAYDRILQIQI
jgi:flagellar hook-basal body complex protein FliE